MSIPDEMLDAGREIFRSAEKEPAVEIPDDVMETAREVCRNEQFRLTAVFGTSFLDIGTIEVVARALMAERERAARIAENAPIEAWATHVDIARREAYKAGVAAAIRNA